MIENKEPIKIGVYIDKQAEEPINVEELISLDNKSENKKWLHRSEIWIYDEITRQFRDAGYSWKKCQKKADVIMRCEQ